MPMHSDKFLRILAGSNTGNPKGSHRPGYRISEHRSPRRPKHKSPYWGPLDKEYVDKVFAERRKQKELQSND